MLLYMALAPEQKLTYKVTLTSAHPHTHARQPSPRNPNP